MLVPVSLVQLIAEACFWEYVPWMIIGVHQDSKIFFAGLQTCIWALVESLGPDSRPYASAVLAIPLRTTRAWTLISNWAFSGSIMPLASMSVFCVTENYYISYFYKTKYFIRIETFQQTFEGKMKLTWRWILKNWTNYTFNKMLICILI